VFTNPVGQPLNPDYLTRRFNTMVTKSGLPPVRLHDLRHGAATLAHAAGADLKTVQEQLGHASIVLTADTYTSVLPELAHKAAEATAQLILRDAGRLSFAHAKGAGPTRPHHGHTRTRAWLCERVKPQVTDGAPPGTRTPNPRIKSQVACRPCLMLVQSLPSTNAYQRVTEAARSLGPIRDS
jgi:hypothetical protein